MTDVKVTPQMIRVLKSIEGFSDAAYHDATGQSIGFGHFIKPGEEALRGRRLTKDQANALLAKDIEGHQREGLSGLKVKIGENQRAALTLLAYNAGPGAAQSVVKLLNSGDTAGAAEKFSEFNKSRANKGAPLLVNPDLVKRRSYEKELFLTRDDRHFNEDFERYRSGKTKVTSIAQKASCVPSSASAFASSPDAARNENLRILAELRQLRAAVGASDAAEEFENRLRREGSGV